MVFSLFCVGLGYVTGRTRCAYTAQDVHYTQDAAKATKMGMGERNRLTALLEDDGCMVIPLAVDVSGEMREAEHD